MLEIKGDARCDWADMGVSLSEGFPVELCDDIWLLGNYFLNLYLVKGDRFSALIEMGTTAVTGAVVRQLETLGVIPDFLVLAHPHADHMAGMPGLIRRFGNARLVAGAGARKFATHPKALEGLVSEDRFITGMFRKMGIEASDPADERFAFPDSYLQIEKQVDIDLGGLTLSCSPLAGHSPGNIVIRVPERKAVFASDSLGFHYPGRGFCPLFFTGYDSYVDSLGTLESFGADILGLGHQGPITGPDITNAFNQARREAERFLQAVRDTTKDDEAIAGDFFRKYYVDEFTLYSAGNIMNCCRLLVRRAREALTAAERSFLR